MMKELRIVQDYGVRGREREREGRSRRWDEVQQWGLDQQLAMGFAPTRTPQSAQNSVKTQEVK
jgi:hypothetical protein